MREIEKTTESESEIVYDNLRERKDIVSECVYEYLGESCEEGVKEGEMEIERGGEEGEIEIWRVGKCERERERAKRRRGSEKERE